MKLFSYEKEGIPHLGSYRDGQPVDLGPGNLAEVLASDGLDKLQSRVADAKKVDNPAGLRYLPLIARPPKIVCVGLNYKDHRAEAGMSEPPKYPDFFVRFPTTLVAHEGIIERPACSEALDFEGELVVIIGKRARGIPAADALSIVAGYSVFNEGSIRDRQFRASQWTWGKNFDATGGFGPVMVTPDELPRSVKQGLKIETRLNGEVMQSATTADLIFDIPTLLEMLSEGVTLEPGDVIVTGTPSGVGFARTPPVYMRHGDTVEVEIEGIGCLRNHVRDSASV